MNSLSHLPAAEPDEAFPEIDCLKRTAMSRCSLSTSRCIATLISAGYATWLDVFLGALAQRGGCLDIPTVVFTVDVDTECQQVLEFYQNTYPQWSLIAVPCQAREPVNQWIKGIIYSLARVVDADYFLCLEVDTLVLGDLKPIFEQLETQCQVQEEVILGVKNGDTDFDMKVEQGFSIVLSDISQAVPLLNQIAPVALQDLTIEEREAWTQNLADQQFQMFNGGVIAANRRAFQHLDSLLCQMQPYSLEWVQERPHDIMWRDEFLFNLAAHWMGAKIPLDKVWNIQLQTHYHTNDLILTGSGTHLNATWHGCPVRILHFVGNSKWSHAYLRSGFAQAHISYE